ncbi:hypothetical protein CLM73_13740 [Achromobacter spanius]|uniref:Uncharacterized protein n=1 Tax=Achromobacter spanius TaxID=217203 RepID=A0A2S0I7R9_9BURK|nr:hypothetical protein CLM73_13740 [Achromobacter spanius]
MPAGLAALAAVVVAEFAADRVAAVAAGFSADFAADFSAGLSADLSGGFSADFSADVVAGFAAALPAPALNLSFTAAALMPQRLAIVATLRPASDIPRKVLSLHAANAPAGARKPSISNAHANAPGLHSVMTRLPHLGAPGQNHARLDHECGLA